MRPTKEETFLKIAQVIAERGTCIRRKVGCVIVNSLGHILSTGYNGVARGLSHCSDSPCAGAGAPSGEKLDLCEAIHAEQNALLQCGDTQAIETCYTTVSPCLHCIKLLMNTSCKQIVFLEAYAGMEKSRALWLSSRTDTIFLSPDKVLRTWVDMSTGSGPFHHPRKFGNLGW